MAAEVEKHNVERVCVIAGDCILDSRSRVLIDQAKHRQISQVSSIDQTHLGLETPVRRHSQDHITDIGASLLTGMALDIPEDHGHHLLQAHVFVSILEYIGVPVQLVAFHGAACVERADEAVEVEVGQLWFLYTFVHGFLLEESLALVEGNLNYKGVTELSVLR